MDIPTLPDIDLPSMNLIVMPTASSPTEQSLDLSQCAVRLADNFTGGLAQGTRNMVVNATTQWMAMDGEEGYRTYWVLGGLLPATNYTAWSTQGEGGNTLSQPIWFTTKQCKFAFNHPSATPRTRISIIRIVI